MRRIGRLFVRDRVDREIASEIAAHIEEQTDDLMASGMSREDALRAARSHFGNATVLQEESRDVWTFMALESLLRDLRIGARSLRRTPVFFVVAAATLALGIGANTAIFSALDAALLRPLPFAAPDRLVRLVSIQGGRSLDGPLPWTRGIYGERG